MTVEQRSRGKLSIHGKKINMKHENTMLEISTNKIHNFYITKTTVPTATNLLPTVRKKIPLGEGD
jgi:hypothetical protein